MAKHSEVQGETEVEAVAREIFAATVVRELGRSTIEHITETAFKSAEHFVAYRKELRQNTGKPKE